MAQPAQNTHEELAPRWRLSVDDVMKMVDAGILTEDDHVELIDGELWEMTPQGPVHLAMKDELHERLADAYRGHAYLRDSGPLFADAHSLPEPDLAVVRGKARDYLQRHASGADALLIVEVSLTSQRRDRHKARIYARAGVPCYWNLDVEARRLTVYERPDRDREEYLSTVTLADSDEVSLPGLPLRWPIASLLP